MSSPLGAVAKCASTLESTGFPRSPAQHKIQRTRKSAPEPFWFTPNYEHNLPLYQLGDPTVAFNSHNRTLVSALVHRAVAITRAAVPRPSPIAFLAAPTDATFIITTTCSTQSALFSYTSKNVEGCAFRTCETLYSGRQNCWPATSQ